MTDPDHLGSEILRSPWSQLTCLEYFPSNHQTALSCSLRMTCKGLLPNTEATVTNLNLTLMGLRRNDGTFPVKSISLDFRYELSRRRMMRLILLYS
jgi:hypothetical protein